MSVITNGTTTKVLFFGTHPMQFNGYSKVVWELCKCSATFKAHGVQFGVFGFQKFFENPAHRRGMPEDVFVYDAHAGEEPKQLGFGVGQVRKVVGEWRPDVCVVYNDMMVLHQIITQLKLAHTEDKVPFKIVAYIDQVYGNQKKEFIDFINANADHAMLFTEYWEKNILDQGIKLPSSFLPHGFNPMTYFPVPKQLARQFFNLKQDDFIVMNLNRNQPRKRWDTCLKAFAEIVSRYPNEPIKLLIATAMQGAWNLLEIYERELKKRNVTLEEGMKHVIVLDNPQKITDEETNILYNVADIGINTCDGEGYGLCQFEQAAMGIPQVVPRLGGFLEFFDDSRATLVEPKLAYYVDSTRDAVCGEALMCDYMDFVEGIEAYYNDKELRARHGQAAREHIVANYAWPDIASKLAKVCLEVAGVKPQSQAQTQSQAQADVADDAELKALADDIEKLDIEELSNLGKKEASARAGAADKEKDAAAANKRDELLALRRKLDQLLASGTYA